MRKMRGRPAWWQLYALGLLGIGLLLLGAFAHLSERGHQIAAMGAVLLACGLVEVWLRANRRELLHIEGLTLVDRSAPAENHNPAGDIPIAVSTVEIERKDLNTP